MSGVSFAHHSPPCCELTGRGWAAAEAAAARGAVTAGWAQVAADWGSVGVAVAARGSQGSLHGRIVAICTALGVQMQLCSLVAAWA